MRKYTEAKKDGNRRWDAANLDRISIALPKGRKAELQAAAERHKQSVNGFINSLIDEALERERAGAVPAGGSPAVSPQAREDTGTQGAGVLVFSDPSQDDNIRGRFISQSSPDSTTGQPDKEGD